VTKDELIGIVKLINVTWPQTELDPKSVYETWWRYLADLDADSVMKVVDEMVIEASAWRPKVGEIRRRVIDEGERWLSPDAAWVLAEACLAAAAQGLAPPYIPPHVAGPLGHCLSRSRNHRVAFIEAWKTETAKRYDLVKPI